MEFNKDNKILFSRLIILGGFVYPIWGFLVYFIKQMPLEHAVWRVPVGLISILVGLSYKSLGKFFLFAIQSSLTLYLLQFGYFLTTTKAPEYAFGTLVVMLGIFIGFLNDPKAFLVHALTCSTAFLAMCWYFDSTSITFAAVRQMIMLYIVMYIISRISRSHTDLIEKLRIERLQLLSEHKNMITENLKNAQSVFTSLAATESHLPNSVSLKSFYRPANEAGGDWIGHFYLKEKNWLILTIGDVTGHDLASSLVTIAVSGAARGTFESLSRLNVDLKSLVQQMTYNSHLAIKHCGVVEKSMTAAFLGIDINTFQGFYVNCAHPPGLFRNDRQTVETLEYEQSQFLGNEDFTVTTMAVDLSHMKSILLYTDGLLENSQIPISEKKLSKWMETSENLHQELSSKLQTVSLEDDISYLLLEKT